MRYPPRYSAQTTPNTLGDTVNLDNALESFQRVDLTDPVNASMVRTATRQMFNGEVDESTSANAVRLALAGLGWADVLKINT